MNYIQIYEKLIDRSRIRTLDGYGEMHHIVPRCMGGTNTKNNLVKLTPEEHYIAHQLLVKIYPNNEKLVFAAHMMCNGRSNKLYGWLKRKHAKSIGNVLSKHGSSNTQYGTKWITDGVRNKKISEEISLPIGWTIGRTYAPKFDKIQKCRNCVNVDNADKWYKEYTNSGIDSMREFVRESDYQYSHVAFFKMIKKYKSNMV
jgi:hypothetical protein